MSQSDFLTQCTAVKVKLQRYLRRLESGMRVGRRIPCSSCEDDRTAHEIENLRREIDELEELGIASGSRASYS